MKQFLWYAMQTAIVVVVVYGYAQTGGERYGLALALGIGWALCATVLIHLAINGLRRLKELILPRRVEDRDPVAIPEDRPLVSLDLLRGVEWRETDPRR